MATNVDPSSFSEHYFDCKEAHPTISTTMEQNQLSLLVMILFVSPVVLSFSIDNSNRSSASEQRSRLLVYPSDNVIRLPDMKAVISPMNPIRYQKMAASKGWKFDDFMTNDEFLNERVTEILIRDQKITDMGSKLNFTNEDELVAVIAVELANMAIYGTVDSHHTSRGISLGLSGLPPFFSRIAQNFINRVQSCKAVVVNFFIRGCGATTSTTTTTTTTAAPSPCGDTTSFTVGASASTATSLNYPAPYTATSSYTCTYTFTAATTLRFAVNAPFVIASSASVKLSITLNGSTTTIPIIAAAPAGDIPANSLSVIVTVPSGTSNAYSFSVSAK